MLITLLISLQASGCYSIRQGALIGIEAIPGTERRISDSTSVSVAGHPSIASPVLELDVRHHRLIEERVRRRYQGMLVPHVFANFVGGAIMLAAGATAIAWGGNDLVGDTLSDNGKLYRASGVVAIIGGIAVLAKAFDRSPPAPAPGHTVFGEPYTAQRALPAVAVPGARLRVSRGPLSRSFVTDESGKTRVHAVNDLGLAVVERPEAIPILVSLEPQGPTLGLTIETASFMRRCVRTLGPGSIWERPSAEGTPVGRFSAREVLMLTDDSRVDWYGVLVRGSTRWIPRQAASTCWSAGN